MSATIERAIPTRRGRNGLSRKSYRLTRTERIIAYGLALGVVLLLLIPYVFFIIPPGHVGVLYRLFTIGTETSFVYPEGLGVKLPWNRIHPYEVRTQTHNDSVQGLATDGLGVMVDITVLFHPVANQVGTLHRDVGPEYIDRLVRPVAISAVRATLSRLSPHEIYQTRVEEFERMLLEQLRTSAAPISLIEYQSVAMRRVELPPTVDAAISRKLSEEQNAQAYVYLIAQAEREAERKRIDAIGIQTFYSIVANALSPQLLTWRGIEATLQIARSNNTKVVIVGGGREQLPLILGSDIAAQPALPAPPAVDPQSNPLPPFNELPRLFDELAPTMSTGGRAPAAGSPRGGGGRTDSGRTDSDRSSAAGGSGTVGAIARPGEGTGPPSGGAATRNSD